MKEGKSLIFLYGFMYKSYSVEVTNKLIFLVWNDLNDVELLEIIANYYIYKLENRDFKVKFVGVDRNYHWKKIKINQTVFLNKGWVKKSILGSQIKVIGLEIFWTEDLRFIFEKKKDIKNLRQDLEEKEGLIDLIIKKKDKEWGVL